MPRRPGTSKRGGEHETHIDDLQHGYNIYDALVVSAALEAGCTTLYSDGLHDGQIIDGQLTIRNPFAGSSG
jgi:predicted nucleic acid-binding protein